MHTETKKQNGVTCTICKCYKSITYCRNYFPAITGSEPLQFHLYPETVLQVSLTNMQHKDQQDFLNMERKEMKLFPWIPITSHHITTYLPEL